MSLTPRIVNSKRRFMKLTTSSTPSLQDFFDCAHASPLTEKQRGPNGACVRRDLPRPSHSRCSEIRSQEDGDDQSHETIDPLRQDTSAL